MELFIVCITVITTVVAFILSKRFRSFLIAVILVACFIYCAFAMRNAVAEEVRTTFIWEFYLKETDCSLGDEYILYFPDNIHPCYE